MWIVREGKERESEKVTEGEGERKRVQEINCRNIK